MEGGRPLAPAAERGGRETVWGAWGKRRAVPLGGGGFEMGTHPSRSTNTFAVDPCGWKVSGGQTRMVDVGPLEHTCAYSFTCGIRSLILCLLLSYYNGKIDGLRTQCIRAVRNDQGCALNRIGINHTSVPIMSLLKHDACKPMQSSSSICVDTNFLHIRSKNLKFKYD